jgi:predicted nucleic acid-binding protein
LIVADSSFIVEGLLKKKSLLKEDQIIIPELALYETTNSIWKHEHVLKDLKDGSAYLSILYELMDAGTILVLSPNQQSMLKTYMIASRHKVSVYDSVFVSLALELGLVLKTYDDNQMRIMRSEAGRASGQTREDHTA